MIVMDSTKLAESRRTVDNLRAVLTGKTADDTDVISVTPKEAKIIVDYVYWLEDKIIGVVLSGWNG